MKIFFLATFLVGQAVAADFPLAQYRLMEMRGKVLIMGLEIATAGGKGEKFDASKALESCDKVDKERNSQFTTMNQRRAQAIKDASAGKAKWEDELKAVWEWDPKLTLNQAIQKQADSWKELSEYAFPCKDEDSLALINNIAEDTNAVDDAPLSICVRMVKAFRKSGVCGRPPLGTTVPST